MVRDDKLYRTTFSLPLAEFIQRIVPDLYLCKLKIRRGRKLERGEASDTQLYGICTTKCGSILRVTAIKELAEMQADEEYRTLYEIEVLSVHQL